MDESVPARSGGEEKFFAGVVMALAALAALGGWLVVAHAGRGKPPGIAPDRERQLAAFALTNQLGQKVTQADLAGKYLVVDFLLTSCSVSCQEVNRHMAEIQQQTAGQPDVRLVSITVDPREDTVPVLADYGAKFGADPAHWLMLTGDKSMLYHLIATSFLNQDLNDPFSYMPGNFSHTDRVAIVDAQGRVQVYFDGLDAHVADAVNASLARLRK